MTKTKSIIGIFLSIVLLFNTTMPIFASNVDTGNIYIDNYVETVDMEGISYTYEYSMKNGNKFIKITNNETGIIETLEYDEQTETIYGDNNEIIANVEVIEKVDNIENEQTRSSWQLVGTETKRISWKEGASATIVAGAIAATLGACYGGITGAGVMAIVGFTVMSNIASLAIGGSLTISMYMSHPPYSPPQQMIKWSFTPWTGEIDTIGPFYA